VVDRSVAGFHDDRECTVGVVAELLSVSVRTLHHWDAVGVVSPSGRTAGGYRVYSASDLARLRRVLLYRDLGMSLERIRDLLAAPMAERRMELEKRREELRERIAHLEEVTASVDRLLAADETGVLLGDEHRAEILGDGWNPQWSLEARRRWGDSTQWAEYTERSADRSADEWRRIVSGMDGVDSDLADAKRAGVTPGSGQANELAERHRQAMSTFFHCTVPMHVLLGRMFVTEPGFADHYNRTDPGLAGWISEVFDANARRHGIDPDTATWG
jgi:DNA-binding transcriptional MerR regulator